MVVSWEEKKRAGNGRCHENGAWILRVACAGGRGGGEAEFLLRRDVHMQLLLIFIPCELLWLLSALSGSRSHV